MFPIRTLRTRSLRLYSNVTSGSSGFAKRESALENEFIRKHESEQVHPKAPKAPIAPKATPKSTTKVNEEVEEVLRF